MSPALDAIKMGKLYEYSAHSTGNIWMSDRARNPRWLVGLHRRRQK